MLAHLRRDFAALGMGRSAGRVLFEVAAVWVAVIGFGLAAGVFVLLEPVQ